jgi:hypothetical protein
MAKKPHPLFAGAPKAVQDLSAQAQSEQRQKARKEWWAQNQPSSGFKKLSTSNKPN